VTKKANKDYLTRGDEDDRGPRVRGINKSSYFKEKSAVKTVPGTSQARDGNSSKREGEIDSAKDEERSVAWEEKET